MNGNEVGVEVDLQIRRSGDALAYLWVNIVGAVAPFDQALCMLAGHLAAPAPTIE